MENVEQIFTKLDSFAESKQPDLVKMCNQYKVRPGHVLGGAGALVTFIIVLIKGYDIICALLTCVYPMIMSIGAINSDHLTVKQKWLTYWCILGTFQTLEMFLGFIFNFIPYFNFIRLAFFVFLMAPQTEGAEIIY